MHTAYLVLAALTILVNAAIAVADYVHAPLVLSNSAEVNVPRSWLPALGTCKTLGAIGLLIAVLANTPQLAIAASAGLVVFFVGAIAFHVRARVFYNIAFPGSYLGFAAATLALAATELV